MHENIITTLRKAAGKMPAVLQRTHFEKDLVSWCKNNTITPR